MVNLALNLINGVGEAEGQEDGEGTAEGADASIDCEEG